MELPPHPVMTVDLAALHGASVKPNPVLSLNHLLDMRAQTHSNTIAVGFPEPDDDRNAVKWSGEVFDFARLRASAEQAAVFYKDKLASTQDQNDPDGGIVALLCPSGPEFLLTLFGCLRLGQGVLLLAPQLTPAAIAHLLYKTSATHLIAADTYRKLAEGALKEVPYVQLVSVLQRHNWKEASSSTEHLCPPLSPLEESSRTAVILHSSGSSGMPKPIPVPHRFLTTIMPFRPSDPPKASFSTTPLFHGGITDLARALAAVEPIWFFPLHKAPVTAETVLKAVDASTNVRWFFSVPYILEMLAEWRGGMVMLKGMDLVSTGGAPLDEGLGTKLVEQSVPLVSRYGSSECGFLMSSHREYAKDKEWAWLREPDTLVGHFRVFEPAAEGRYELVLTKDWPHITLSNRLDGGYATGDLFEKHPTIPRAWRYAGRADDIIVMLNGEKTDPAPLEAAICASPNISSAVVFGASRSTCGTLIHLSSLPNSRSCRPANFVASLIEPANRIAPTHSCLVAELVIVIPPGGDWPVSSKGLVQRSQALKRYANEIDRAYEAYEKDQESNGSVRGEVDVHAAVRRAVEETLLEAAFDDEDDLFAMGVTSVQSTRIRSLLHKAVALPNRNKLSSTVVFEYPSVTSLTRHILALQHGRSLPESNDETESMLEFVKRYSAFDRQASYANGHVDEVLEPVILLTGATGALGAHLLSALLRSTPKTQGAHIVCLCRARNDSEACERVRQSLAKRKLPPLSKLEASQVQCFAAKLGEDCLGLDEAVWNELSRTFTMVIHAAWAVNFVARLSSYEKDHIRGLHNLLSLVASSPRLASTSFVLLSSGASVSASLPPISERPSTDPADAAPLGYGRSKWVAERICAEAACQLSACVRIIRAGQICGDSKEGVWNESEYWPLLVRSAKHTGCLPGFDDYPSWLPIDVAASTILDLAFAPAAQDAEEAPVFHVANRHATVSWRHILDVFRTQGGIEADVVPAEEWLRRVEAYEEEGQDVSKGLLDMWKAQFGRQGPANAPVVLETVKAEEASATLRSCGPIADDLIVKMASHWV